MSVVSVSQAAAELAVSPRRVRQMLADGALPGRRVGREWVIERRALDQMNRHRVPAGRPWRPASAWAVLALSSDGEPDLSPVDRSRARRRLADRGLSGLVDRLSARADAREFYGHPSVLGRLSQEPAVVRSGVSAAAEYGADINASDAFEAYVPEDRLAKLVAEYGLDAHADRPNILLHVVDVEVWPFAPAASVAPRPVVAVDLLEADDQRTKRAGAALARLAR